MAITVCKNCTKRYLGCHDKCSDYQTNKAQYKQGGYDDAKGYLVDKHYKLKKDFGGRR